MVIIVLAFIADFISASQARLTGTWRAEFDGTYPGARWPGAAAL